MREVFPIVHRLSTESTKAGLEFTKVAPGWDPGYTTALYGLGVVCLKLKKNQPRC
jgi:hypothetical protein